MRPRRGSKAAAHCGIVAAIGASAWGLVGCGADPGDAEAGAAAAGVAEPVTSAENGSSATTAPQAFVFESGVLEIGDFDPYTLGDNIFDPCTEITPEEFAAAGLDRVEPLPEEYAGLARGLSVCEILDAEGVPIANLFMTNVNRELISSSPGLIAGSASEELPMAFSYGPRNGEGVDCFVQVDTTRGGLVVGVGGLSGIDTHEATCATATELMERMSHFKPEV